MLTLTEQEFMELARQKCSLYRAVKMVQGYRKGDGDFEFCGEKKEKAKLTLKDAYLYCSWSGGGISGGSCWGDKDGQDPHYATTGEPEPEFEDLDNFLMEICPGMSFLQYKKLAQSIKRGDYSVNEYYGNSSSHVYKTVSLYDLYNVLVGLGLIQ